MAITAKELREKRATLVKAARAILDKAETEKRDPNAEERAQWDKIMGGTDAEGKRVRGEEEKLLEQITNLDRVEALEGEMRTGNGGKLPGSEQTKGGTETRTGPTEEQRALALQAWTLRNKRFDLTDKHLEACKLTGFDLRQSEIGINLHAGDYREVRRAVNNYEMRAGAASPQASVLTTAGGALVPEGFMMNLERALLQFGGIRQVANVMRTETGQPLPWPTVNDTTVKGRRLAENAQINTKDVSFGTITFGAYLYTSDIVLVPVTLAEDSAFNLSTLIGSLLGERVGRIQADEFTTLNVAGGPIGIMAAATSGVTAAVSTAMAADDLYTLKHSVDPAYRAGANWMMHDSILLAIKKLKDGFGRYLWQSSLAGGAPDTLDGDPIQINQSMDSTLAASKKTVSYGLHSKYTIRDVAEIRIRQLVERYADLDQIAFLAMMRSDANLLDAGTHPVKYMVQS